MNTNSIELAVFVSVDMSSVFIIVRYEPKLSSVTGIIFISELFFSFIFVFLLPLNPARLVKNYFHIADFALL